jgi:hypothetical protein
MVLHQHPANERREDEGRSTINSLWLWGAGQLPTGASAGFAGVWSDNVLARGLGRAFNVPVHAVPGDAGTLLAQAPRGSRQLLVLDALQSPVQYEDADAYRAELLDLDKPAGSRRCRKRSPAAGSSACASKPRPLTPRWPGIATAAPSGNCGVARSRWRPPRKRWPEASR